jgi:SAM-dependent methyltransferase
MNWFQFCEAYIWERVTGNPKMPLTHWALSVTGKPRHLLEVGCLDGKKVAGLLKAGKVERASGMDIAAGAVERGRELHPDVEFFVGDLNRPDLPSETYDVILANGVLHHIENIDVCIKALHGALKPGGWLVSGDFTGPRRYSYSDEEIALIHEGQAMLPEEIRGALFHPDQLATKLQNDPSESITTTTIVPTLRSVFDEVIERRYGGNVLQRALTKTFFRTVDRNNPEHTSAVERMQEFDREVSQDYSHHTYCLSRKAA